MKKAVWVSALLVGVTLCSALPSQAQFKRYDYVWARSTGGAQLTLDGVLNEPQWAQAESVIVRYGRDNGIPGSGWKDEGGLFNTDTTYAVFRFLTVGNQLWIGAFVRDSMVGGSSQFNRFDGLLMSIKQHDQPNRPSAPGEHFVSWWWPPESGDPAPTAINKGIDIIGRWRSWARPTGADSIQAFDARATVSGKVNSDTTADFGYWIEMRSDLGMNGYNVTQPQGDIVEWNASVYDCDHFWPLDNWRFGAARSWIQDPWGNDAWYHNERIYARPDVTVNSGAVPVVGPDMNIPVAPLAAAPVIDGKLDEAVWQHAPSFDIRYDDAALRNSYPATGPYRSGQYQPPVNGNGGNAFILPGGGGDATLKYFYAGTKLFIGLDVRDDAVQYIENFDRWDGGILMLNDRFRRGPDKNLLGHRLSYQVGPTGQLLPRDEMAFLRDTLHVVEAELQLKPGTTVDTLGQNIDEGYTVEIAVDLAANTGHGPDTTSFGYKPDLGDHVLYWAFDLLDGDSFVPFTDSYSTRTWFFRETENRDGACVALLNPNVIVAGVEGGVPPFGNFALLGSFPNPMRDETTIRYVLPEAARVDLEVFDLQGRLVTSRSAGVQAAGQRELPLPRFTSRAGVFMYRVKFGDPQTRASKATLAGKIMVVQ